EIFQHAGGGVARRRPEEQHIGDLLRVAAGPQGLELGEVILPGLVPDLDLDVRVGLHELGRHLLVAGLLFRAAPKAPRDRHLVAARRRGRSRLGRGRRRGRSRLGRRRRWGGGCAGGGRAGRRRGGGRGG